MSDQVYPLAIPLSHERAKEILAPHVCQGCMKLDPKWLLTRDGIMWRFLCDKCMEVERGTF
jgi:hypothetical protein